MEFTLEVNRRRRDAQRPEKRLGQGAAIAGGGRVNPERRWRTDLVAAVELSAIPTSRRRAFVALRMIWTLWGMGADLRTDRVAIFVDQLVDAIVTGRSTWPAARASCERFAEAAVNSIGLAPPPRRHRLDSRPPSGAC
jgi:hypothetical protein